MSRCGNPFIMLERKRPRYRVILRDHHECFSYRFETSSIETVILRLSRDDAGTARPFPESECVPYPCYSIEVHDNVALQFVTASAYGGEWGPARIDPAIERVAAELRALAVQYSHRQFDHSWADRGKGRRS